MIFLFLIILFVFTFAAMLAGLSVAGISMAFGERSVEKFQSVWFSTTGIIILAGIIYFIFVIL